MPENTWTVLSTDGDPFVVDAFSLAAEDGALIVTQADQELAFLNFAASWVIETVPTGAWIAI